MKQMNDPVEYTTAHRRPRNLWGKPSAYPCINCGKQARDWAYDGTDPEELVCWIRGVPFSRYPEFYMPMCKPCHKTRDNHLRTQPCWCGRENYAKNLCPTHYHRHYRMLQNLIT